jgi:hypothetical protein
VRRIKRILAGMVWTSAFMVGVSSPASGAIFDWDAEGGWPGGPTNFSNSYTDIDGLTGVGLDVDVFDGASLIDVSPDGSPPSLEVNSFLTPPGAVDNLFVRADNNGSGSGVTFQFDFTGVVAVTDVFFDLYDIDADTGTQWIDVLVITGFALAGGTVTPTVTGTNSSWSYDGGTGTITGSQAAGNQGNGNNNATALVSFVTPITGFTITYQNGQNPGGNQWIGVADLAFNVVPEPGAGLLLISAAALFTVCRRRP